MASSHAVPYSDQGVSLEGFAVSPNPGKHPAIILCHAWKGRDPFICERAELMAKWGYVGFALDMYGKGILGKSKEECAALKKPFLEDRRLLQRRLLKGYEAALSLPQVDSSRIAVIGYGFGGLCALDLARSGVELKGAVSLYGHFEPPSQVQTKPIRAKVLILQGYNDPVATQNDLRAFEKEMNESQVDWQAHIYGGTYHAFATPGVNDPASGLAYNPLSAERALRSIRDFLAELFA